MSRLRILAVVSTLITSALLALSCKPGDSDQDTPSCDTAADHLIELCSAYPGEEFRALCETEDGRYVTPAVRRCVSEIEVCDEASFERCEVRSVVIGCSDGDCPAPLICEPENMECVRCVSDGDCTLGRGCWMGLCYEKDSDFYRAVSAAPDAGSP